MSYELSPNALSFIKLSYEQHLSDERLKGVEDKIRQAGLQIRYIRRFTAQQLNSIDRVVEIIANYDDMLLDDWSDLTDSIVQTHCWSAGLGSTVYNMRKRISAPELREASRRGNRDQISLI